MKYFRIFRKSIKHKGKEYFLDELEAKYEKLCSEMDDEHNKDFNNDLLEDHIISSLELTDLQLSNLETYKLNKKASSWKSYQRKLRKEGKLEQFKIDKLNDLGMLWYPDNEDQKKWELYYSKFRDRGFIDPLEDWVNNQRELYENGKLSDENLRRLKAAKFPFLKNINEKFELTYHQLFHMIEERKKGRKKLSNRANQLILFYEGLADHPDKKEELIKLSEHQEKKLSELKNMNDDDFEDEINKILKREYSFERIDGVNYPSKFEFNENKYFDCFKYINGRFESLMHEPVKFHCSEKIKVYAAETALLMLNDNILKTGRMNDVKSFPPVAKLISYYSKNKMIKDLERIANIIYKYPILKAIYGERIQKLLNTKKS